MTLAQWMEVLLSDHNPLLPTAAAMQAYSRGAWAAALMGGVLWVLRIVAERKGLVVSMTVPVKPTIMLTTWIVLPGGLSPAYWLGLAFNAPALMSVLLCIWLDKHSAGDPSDNGSNSRWGKAYAVLGVVWGYALLLDTLALLPVQLYAWGFSPAALACALAVSVLPCVALNPWQRGNRWTLLLPSALLVFVLTRFPTGNVWDVVLDPLLWVALHIYLLITVRQRARAPAATRA